MMHRLVCILGHHWFSDNGLSAVRHRIWGRTETAIKCSIVGWYGFSHSAENSVCALLICITAYVIMMIANALAPNRRQDISNHHDDSPPFCIQNMWLSLHLTMCLSWKVCSFCRKYCIVSSFMNTREQFMREESVRPLLHEWDFML